MTFYLLRINMEVPVFFYYKFKCGTWWKRLASAQWRNVGRRWLRSPPAGAPSILLILISIFACPWLPYQIFGAPCKFLSIGHCIVNEYYLAPFAQKRCLRCSRGNHAYVTPLHLSIYYEASLIKCNWCSIYLSKKPLGLTTHWRIAWACFACL